MNKAVKKNLISILAGSSTLLLLLMPCAVSASSEASALEGMPALNDAGIWAADSCGEATEMHLFSDQAYTTWAIDPGVLTQDQGDAVVTRRVSEQQVRTVKLANLIPAVHFRAGEADIPEGYLEQMRGILDTMRERNNVRLHFVGHADSQRLSDELMEIYGDNVGLSRERAGTVAEYCQQQLQLPPEAISYEGLGDRNPVADNDSEAGRAKNRRVEVEVWYDEIDQKLVDREVFIPRQISRIKVCRSETVCKLRYKEGHNHRARVKNLLPPLHYESGVQEVPENFLRQVRQTLKNLSDKSNVTVKFIAYTDTQPLAGREKRIYVNHLGLSKAVARRVAVAVQEGLDLKSTEIDSEGAGATRPVASNDTPKGRALNRRVVVEFWYDDPLQELPDEPQICPEAAAAETVTRVYHPAGGNVAPILFKGGDPVILEETVTRLRTTLAEVAGKTNVRLRFIGYTRNQRLERRVAMLYGDDIGWSAERARKAMEAVKKRMGLTPQQSEFEGRGYVQSQDVINAGFIESDTSRVEVEIVYDELVALDWYDGVEIERLIREVSTSDPFALNQMRISVDGAPMDDLRLSIPDVQRCTDLALDRARVQFKHDSLAGEPRLNVTAWPPTISDHDAPETAFVENRVHFRVYSNYRNFIARAEVRIFPHGASLRGEPFAVVPLDDEGEGAWDYRYKPITAPGDELNYLVRVYDAVGYFDETAAQPLWILDRPVPELSMDDKDKELLVGYGESRLTLQTIPLHGGTVQASGHDIPAGHSVWLAGHQVPLAADGAFVAEEILPHGLHTVEVAVLDGSGNGDLFLRDLTLDRSDWFTIGIADLTFAANRTNGPADQLNPDRPQYSEDWNANGRLAFFTRGKFGLGWNLTASADTREGPLDEVFSNFLDKSPEALFRRIDPDAHYPTYGDDGSVSEEAPTSGKFYLKLQKDHSFGLWGNFKLAYLENSLAQVDRGLYGANLHYQTQAVTAFGEQRLKVDGFAADPGTVGGRDEFRATGGSLYYLQRQDILIGSERLRIEIRDKDSGLVLGVNNLVPELDYNIDYLQGRILLAEPLSTVSDDELLVADGSFSGHPQYLVARYEFTPGVDSPELMTTGGRVEGWLNDHVKLGATASNREADERDSTLYGGDVTLRHSAQTWVKVETGRSEGDGQSTASSQDGGFNFSSPDASISDVGPSRAYRADASLAFDTLVPGTPGRVTLYTQELEAGYTAPGLRAETDTTQHGGTLEIPVRDRLTSRLKVDTQTQEERIESDSAELDLAYQFTPHWEVSSGLRRDSRKDLSAGLFPLSEVGERADGAVRLRYDSRERWSSYGFFQETLASSGNRGENGRYGIGGSHRFGERLKLEAELSDGDRGAAGRFGSEYLVSDRSTLYLNYSNENERTDNGLRARKGNLTSGFRSRYSDSMSLYVEERYAHGDVPTGLMHAAGVDLAPSDRVNFGANIDHGTLKDPDSGSEVERIAAGVNVGYGFEDAKWFSAVEYRQDETVLPGSVPESLTTWLFKNSLSYRTTPDWRLIGKFNYAFSDSPAGSGYDGEFIEAVLGYAYRPVDNDRLNALLKYTYLYDVPTLAQVGSTGESLSGLLQKSHIASLDATYELTSRWSIGGKYAYRLGEVAFDRVAPEYLRSQAHLYVVRVDWHFVHRWDALLEGRMLDLPDSEELRSGALVGIYRHFGNHVKFGVGYNFSDFSDDLSDYDYDHQGLFINLVGKY